MKRLCLALIGLAALSGAAAAADLSAAAAGALLQGSGCVPVLQLDRLLHRHQRRRRLRQFGVGFDRQPQHVRRPGRRHGRLQLSVRPSCVGVEGDIDWADINGTTTTACPLGCKTSDTWLSTVRGRLGYAADRFMPFVTGGAAFGNVRASTPGFAEPAAIATGWTLGGGLEAALAPNWTAQGRISLRRSRQLQLRAQLRQPA